MATDGQTLGGSISTGSHDAAIHFGSIQEHVKGIHLVIPGETVYVQRNSDPVLTENYVVNTLGADRLISNDDMFNAALVSFGSFGVVHGYLLQTEKMFKLKVEVSEITVYLLSSLN
jgi:FAD/FMN-containing dehydrogenase